MLVLMTAAAAAVVVWASGLEKNSLIVQAFADCCERAMARLLLSLVDLLRPLLWA